MNQKWRIIKLPGTFTANMQNRHIEIFNRLNISWRYVLGALPIYNHINDVIEYEIFCTLEDLTVIRLSL